MYTDVPTIKHTHTPTNMYTSMHHLHFSMTQTLPLTSFEPSYFTPMYVSLNVPMLFDVAELQTLGIGQKYSRKELDRAFNTSVLFGPVATMNSSEEEETLTIVSIQAYLRASFVNSSLPL